MIKRKKQAGFSLIELMVGIVIGLFVTGVVITVFAQSKRNYNQDEELGRLQENGRYAIQLLARDLAMAGFLGNMQIADDVTVNLGTDNDCGIDWNTESPLLKPLIIFDDDNATEAADAPSCLSTALAGTEILVIKRMRGSPVTNPGIDKIIMRSNGKDGTLYVTSTSEATPANYQDWEYLTRAYYIADEDGDGVPGLYRKHVYASSGALQVESEGNIVPGVEDFRVTYGIDTSGDGIADSYVATPTLAELSTAVSARIDILVRTMNPDPSYDNTKTYNIGAISIAGSGLSDSAGNAGHFYGRVFSATVQMRNVAYHIQIRNLSEDSL
jgi:type IV pilus assembly protein PilW